MNITPLIIGSLLVVLGVAFILFRSRLDRARDAHLASIGDHTRLAARMLTAVKINVVLGSAFILFGVFAIVAAFFPLARS